MSSRWPAAALVLATLVALAIRLPDLASRPMHGDEAVHAIKLLELWQDGRYHYDPHEYHGPTLYYLTLPVLWMSGVRDAADVTETHLRLVPALCGAAMLPLLWLLRDLLGRPAIVIAALLAACSPLIGFYNRYYIQESLLVLFTLLALAAGWRFARSRRIGWAVLAGAAVALMQASKETALIVWTAAGCAAIAGLIWNGLLPAREAAAPQASPAPSGDSSSGMPRVNSAPRRLAPGIAVAAISAVLVSVVLFSTFFTNPAGPLDSLRAYAIYVSRGGGGEGLHLHPWDYYLKLLTFQHYPRGPAVSEALTLALALIGTLAALLRRAPAGASLPGLRYVTFVALALLAGYSILPYKTPWCIVGPLHILTLLAGCGAAVILESIPRVRLRALPLAALLAGIAHIAWQSCQVSFVHQTDRRNPLLYAHPLTGVQRLGRRILDVADCAPAGRDTLVFVFADNPWPLPWYIRGLHQVGWWEQPPDRVDAPIVVVDAALAEPVAARMQNEYVVDYHGLRPEEVLLLLVEKNLWQEYLKCSGAISPTTDPAGNPAP